MTDTAEALNDRVDQHLLRLLPVPVEDLPASDGIPSNLGASHIPVPAVRGWRSCSLLRQLLTSLLSWILPLIVIGVWEVASLLGWIPKRILPAPSHVLSVAWTLTRNGILLHHLLVSLGRGLASLALGGALGLLFGLVTGLFRFAEIGLDSSFQMLRTIPSLAMIPLAILWFGIGEECKIFLMVLGVFFPLYITAFNGVRSIDPKLVEVARVYGLSRWQLIRHALLPAALPHLLVGLRLSLGFMWINLIVVETIATDSGIGYLVNNAREFMQTDIIVLGIVIYALIGKSADALTRLLERRFLTWSPQFRGM